MQSMLFLACLFTASAVAGNVSPQGSVCTHGTGTCHDESLTDEVSLLQTTNRIKGQKNIRVEVDKSSQASLAQQVSSSTLQTNLVYVRICKTGSTSTASAIRRIADHQGLSGVYDARVWPTETGEPGIWAQHGALDTEEFGENPANEPVLFDDQLPSVKAVQALKMPAFLYTVVRDPAARAMSKYYFNMGCARGKDMPFAEKLDFLPDFQNNQFRYIRMSAQSTMDDIFNSYGVIGMTERLDESLVVLAASLKVPLSDVLYLAMKDSSKGFTIGKGDKQKQCSGHPSLSEEPQDVKDFLDGSFRQANDLDYELIRRANSTLSAKIAEMKLEPAIQQFKDLLAQAQEACKVDGANTSRIAEIADCYLEDEGCNHKCLDQFDQIGREMCEWCD